LISWIQFGRLGGCSETVGLQGATNPTGRSAGGRGDASP
jgi:hypothetical protein